MRSRIARHAGSFRVRLVAYFLLLALLPLVAALWAFGEVAARSETSSADSRLNAALRVATADYNDQLETALRTARSLARETGYRLALNGTSEEDLSGLFREEPNAAFFRGERLVAGQVLDVPAETLVARVVDGNGNALGRVVVHVPLDERLLDNVRARSGLEDGDVLVLTRGGTIIAGSNKGATLRVPGFRPDTVELVGEEYRGSGALISNPLDVRLAVLVPQSKIDDAAADLRRRLILFSAVALTVVALIAYALGRTIVRSLAELANAAGAVARGDYSSRVPVRGRDEFARLGAAFNDMGAQLETRRQELVEERARARAALTRFGEALAVTNDTIQLLPVIVESIVEATGASGGRLFADGEELARAGRPDSRRQALEIPLGDVAKDGGLLLLTPRGSDFSDDTRELAHWLGSKAWKAIEAAWLHGRLKQEVVTDELTDLPNRRGFQQALETELVRAERLKHPIGLILADLDDFKQVNDRHGHLVGDEVLRAFADVLRDTVREIDLAARYGGEEFGVILRETDREGAELVAERLRAAMAEQTTQGYKGIPFTVTASFGVAAYPEIESEDELVAAADEALYAAKRSGKNCVRVAAGRRATVRPEA